MTKRAKISVTLRTDLLDWLKIEAPKQNKSKSRLIEDSLLPLMKSKKEE